MELLPGDRLGRYEIVRRLAAGGMAEVYLAKSLGHAGFVKPIALKRILPNQVSEPEYRDMFLREAAFAARLNHTNIVHVFDFSKEQDELYLAMEYIHGVNLQKLHNDSIRRFSETGDPAFHIHPMLAANICRCVCRALHHAWNVLDENGQPLHLIHRDVSPQNILLSYEGDIKLADFGIARPAELTTSVGIKGKLRYMSPEQALGRKLNAGTDIFSLGIVLYETALGLPSHLFHSDSRESILDAVINRPIDPPVVVNSNFPPLLSRVIAKALERDPQKRFQTAIEFVEALEESIQQESKSAQDYDLASFVQRLYGKPCAVVLNTSPQPQNVSQSKVTKDQTTHLSPIILRLRERLPHFFHRLFAERSWKGKQSSKEVTSNMGLLLDDTENIEPNQRRQNSNTALDVSDSSNPQGTVIFEDSTSCDLAWSDLNAAIPTTMREHSDLLRSFLATTFAGVRAFGDSVVRLEGAQLPHATNTAFFAIFLGPSVTASPGNQLGTCTFMTHAEPLAQQLRTLEPNTKKLVVVVANTAELGKGVRERIAEYQEEHQAIVIPLYLKEIIKAGREQRLVHLLEDRLFDLHPRPNLFSRRGREPDPTCIVGLEASTNELISALREPGAVVLVYGAPGCGKSSLIRMAEYGLEKEHFIKIKCAQIMPRTPDALAEEIGAFLSISMRVPTNPIASLQTSRFELNQLQEAMKFTQVLVLEDVDWLVEQLASSEAESARGLVVALAQRTSAGTMRIIITGYASEILAKRRINGWHNPLAAMAICLPLPPLYWRASSRLIRELGLGCNLHFENDAIREIHHQAGGNIQVLLQLCSHIVEVQRGRLNEHPMALVEIGHSRTIESIEAMVKNSVGLQGGALDLLDDIERRVLEAIAIHSPTSLRRLQLRLHDFAPLEVATKLERLQNMGLVGRSLGRERVTIPLLAAWLSNNMGAQAGEAKREKNRKRALTGVALSLGLLFVAMFILVPRVNMVQDGEVGLKNCTFKIYHPQKIGAGESFSIKLLAEKCNIPMKLSKAFSAKPRSNTTIEKQQRYADVSCDYGLNCSAEFKLVVGNLQSSNVELMISSKETNTTNVKIEYDQLSFLQQLVFMALKVLSVFLTIVGLWIAFHERLLKTISKVRSLVTIQF